MCIFGEVWVLIRSFVELFKLFEYKIIKNDIQGLLKAYKWSLIIGLELNNTFQSSLSKKLAELWPFEVWKVEKSSLTEMDSFLGGKKRKKKYQG